MSSPRLLRLLPGLAAASLLLGANVASAAGLVGSAPSVQVPMAGAMTQAQLADALRAQGYSEIRLSAVAASPVNPHPETNSSLTSHPEQVAARFGWNGVATKDGQQVQVYVVR